MIQIPLINYLFGGSLPIMGVFLTMVGLPHHRIRQSVEKSYLGVFD